MPAAGTHRHRLQGIRNPRNFVLAFAFPLAIFAASCGMQEGHETLEVHYDGVPLNLEAASQGVDAASLNGSDSVNPVDNLDDNPVPESLALVDDEELEDAGDGDPGSAEAEAATSQTEDRQRNESETDRQAHIDPPSEDPLPEDPLPEDTFEPDPPADDLESAESDLNARNRRALRSFRGLVANATNLGNRSVGCIAEYVRTSGVNVVSMNRILRRGLNGSAKSAPPRFVAVAYDAANSCGVTLSESLLR